MCIVHQLKLGVPLRGGNSAFACIWVSLTWTHDTVYEPANEKYVKSILSNKKYFVIVISVISFQQNKQN